MKFHSDEQGMIFPIHAAVGALIGLSIIGISLVLDKPIGIIAAVCAILLAFITHAWIDAYNRDIDHIIEDNPLRDRVIYWVIVGVGLALTVASAVKLGHVLVYLCAFAACFSDVDHIIILLGIWKKGDCKIHRAMTQPWLIDNGSNRARAIIMALAFGAILL